MSAPDQDKEQRTEDATPRKKEKLREEGKVIKSQDVGGAAVLAAVGGTFAAIGPAAALDVLELSERAFSLRDAHQPLAALSATLPVLGSTVLPVIAVAFVAASTAGVIQTQGLFSLKLLEFKPERLDPIPNLKNVLPSKQSLTELGKNLLKVAVLGGVVYHAVRDAHGEFAVLPSSEPVVAAATVGGIATRVALHGAIAFALIAALDYWLAARKYAEDAKMSRQDVKDEHKEQEGRPEVKAQQRRRMREAVAKRKAISDVAEATVLVCNPTHIAIALRYEPERDAAPTVVAKGVENVALQMRQVARSNGVPVVENRPLARAMHVDAKVGRTVPVEHYRAVAEVIAHVMQLGRRPSGGPS